MAARTWEGCTFPDEQAAPEETATPSRSKAITAVSAFTPADANRVVFGSRSARIPENNCLRRDRAETFFEEVPKSAHMRGFFGKLPMRHLCCRAERHDPGDVFSPSPRAALLAATANERIGEMNVLAAPHQRADAFKSADLVARKRQQVRAERTDIESECVRPPAPHRHAAIRRPHARSQRLPQRAAPHRSHYWRA